VICLYSVLLKNNGFAAFVAQTPEHRSDFGNCWGSDKIAGLDIAGLDIARLDNEGLDSIRRICLLQVEQR